MRNQLPQLEVCDIRSAKLTQHQKRMLLLNCVQLAQVKAAEVRDDTLWIAVDFGDLAGRQLAYAIALLLTRARAQVERATGRKQRHLRPAQAGMLA